MLRNLQRVVAIIIASAMMISIIPTSALATSANDLSDSPYDEIVIEGEGELNIIEGDGTVNIIEGEGDGEGTGEGTGTGDGINTEGSSTAAQQGENLLVEGEEQVDTEEETTLVCTCETLCQSAADGAECPVCSASANAWLFDCEGEDVYSEGQYDVMPTSNTILFTYIDANGDSISVTDGTPDATDLTWTALTSAGGVLDEGNYYLTEDVTTASTITIAANTEVNLCLNGFALEYNGTSTSIPFVTVNANGTLNLFDAATVSDTPQGYAYDGALNTDAPTDDSTAYTVVKGGVITGGYASNGGGVYVIGAFNMHGGTIAGNTATGTYGGGGVYVCSSSTSTASFTMNNSASVVGNSVTGGYGGGVSIASSSGNASFTMNDTASVANNTASVGGGGVYVYGWNSSYTASFTMNDTASVANNTAPYGGGVAVYYSNFSMTGGSITDNTGVDGGGVYVTSSGTFEMSEGTSIANNTASSKGGGVYVNNSGAVFNMTGGSISGNNANSTDSNTGGGGGVYLYYGAAFNMSGTASITDNTAVQNGGGVEVYNTATFTMTGGTITRNIAGSSGCGVFGRNGTINVGGAVQIVGNAKEDGTLSNVYLYSSTVADTIGVVGDLSGASIGVRTRLTPTGAAPIQITTTADTTSGISSGADYIGCFTADNSTYTVSYGYGGDTNYPAGNLYLYAANDSDMPAPPATHDCDCHYCINSDGSSVAITDSWTAIGSNYFATNGYTLESGSYYLSGDVTTSSTITIAADNTVNLCLNGFVLKYDSTQGDASVITVSGTLNLYDSDADSKNTTEIADPTGASDTITVAGGLITGGSKTGGNGGGVIVNGTGIFTMYGGTIAGNAVSNTSSGGSGYGGGVYVTSGGTFTMRDGTITGNKANAGTSSNNGTGGGVLSDGTLNMYGGTIENNYSSGNGGGVSISNKGTFTMTGGTIQNNKASNAGGVIVNNDDATLNMSGGTITGNTATGGGGGVYVNGSKAVFNMSGTATVTSNTATSGGGVYVSSGTLNMTVNSGSITSNTATNGGGVYVSGGALNMSGAANIEDNTASGNGGGVYVTGTASTFSMEGGTITDNHVADTTTGYGGGVYLTGGAFTMSGGSITYNDVEGTGYGHGGGVYVNSGTFEMSSTASIANNSIKGSSGALGGGVYVYAGEFTMSDTASVSDNTSSNYAGGVYVNVGEFTMSDSASVSSNTASTSAGGVYVNAGEFTMSDSANISNNKLTGGATYGGGVRVSGGTFNMEGGSITGNSALNGGGVYLSGGTFNMSGGSITKNTASYGGVYLGGGTFNVSGEVSITGNTISTTSTTESNVYLPDEKIITVADALAATASISVTTKNAPEAGSPVVITSGASTKVGDDSTATYATAANFTSTAGYVASVNSSGEVELSLAAANVTVTDSTGASTVTGYSSLTSAITAAKANAGATVTLLMDATMTYEISIYSTMTIDLNGFDIIYSGTDSDSVIYVGTSGTLTLVDNTTERVRYVVGTGSNAVFHDVAPNSGTYTTITGGAIRGGTGHDGQFGGGVCIASTGTFNMEGGNIVGNKAYAGGGVYVVNGATNAKFNMSGGTIANNATTSGGGGGITLQSGTHTISGGTITNNYGKSSSGGVAVGSVTLTITGGTISGNSTESSSGDKGLTVASSAATVTISGDPVIDLAGLVNEAELIINGALDDDASIGVMTYTAAVDGTPVTVAVAGTVADTDNAYTITDTDFACFSKANTTATGTLTLNDNGIQLVAPHVHSWSYAQGKMTDADNAEIADITTIVATCTNDVSDCDCESCTIQIVAPTVLAYTGSAIEATLNSTLDDSITKPTIVYYEKNSNGEYVLMADDELPTDVGDYKAVITLGEVTAYVEYSIVKASVSVDWTVGTYTYTGNEITEGLPTASYTIGNTTTQLVVAPNGEAAFQNVGDYTFTASFASGDANSSNYSLNSDNSTEKVTIKQASNSISDLTIAGWTYGGYDEDGDTNKPSASATFGGNTITYSYYSDESCTTAVTPSDALNAGTYYVKATVAETTNYALEEAKTSFTIEKAVITITEVTVSASKTYDGTTAVSGSTLTIEGAVNNETPELSATVVWDSAAIGTTTASASNFALTTASVNDNYIISTSQATTVATTQAESVRTIAYDASSAASVSGIEASYEYEGENLTPEPIVTVTLIENDSAVPLVKGTDYTLSYANNGNPGNTSGGVTATVTITYQGNYTGTTSKTFVVKDTTVPTIALSYKDGASNVVTALFDWIMGKDSITITVEAKDAGTGVASVSYTKTETSGVKTTGTLTDGVFKDGVYTLTIGADWQGDITFTATDVAGNKGTASVSNEGTGGVLVEANAPVIVITEPTTGNVKNGDGWYNATATLSVSVVDNAAATSSTSDSLTVVSSGLASVSYKIGVTGTEVKVDESVLTKALTTNTDFTIDVNATDMDATSGSQTIIVTAIDNLGNTSTESITLKIDATTPDPVATSTGVAGVYTLSNGNDKAETDTSAASSQTSGTTYSVSGTNASISDNTLTVTKAGTYTITATSGAGLSATTKVVVVVLETDGTTNTTSATYGEDVVVLTAAAADGTSDGGTYQWYKVGEDGTTGTAISGATGSTLTLADVADSGKYYVVITDTATGKTTQSENITVSIALTTATIVWTGTNATYDGSAQTPIATLVGVAGGDSSDDSTGDDVSVELTYTDASGNSSTTVPTAAGTYTVTATLTGKDAGNYTISNPTTSFTIAKATVAVTLGSDGKVSSTDDIAYTTTYTGNAGETIVLDSDGNVISYTGGYTTTDSEGNIVTNTVTITTSDAGYTITNTNGENQVVETITGDGKLTYDIDTGVVYSDGTTYTITPNGSTAETVTITDSPTGVYTITTSSTSYTVSVSMTAADADNYYIAGLTTGNNTIGTYTVSAKSYTTTFTNSENPADDVTYTVQSGTTITVPAGTDVTDNDGNTQAFAGWSYGGATYKANDTFTQPSQNIAFTAVYEKTYTISGSVVQVTTIDAEGKETTSALANAAVTLMSGSNQIAETTTGANGEYEFHNVPAGTYNIVVTYNGTTRTSMVTITDGSAVIQTITMPTGDTSSVVVVAAGTPDVVVGGLDSLFYTAVEDNSTSTGGSTGGGDDETTDDETTTPTSSPNDYTTADKDVVDAGGSVALALTVETTASTVTEIEDKSGSNEVGLYLDIDITKTVTDDNGKTTTSDVTETSEYLYIVIPLPAELQGKASYTVYRSHDYDDGNGKVIDTITTDANAAGEELAISTDTTYLTLKVKYFSTYAVAYKEATVSNNGGSSSTDGWTNTTDATSDEPTSPATGQTEANYWVQKRWTVWEDRRSYDIA